MLYFFTSGEGKGANAPRPPPPISHPKGVSLLFMIVWMHTKALQQNPITPVHSFGATFMVIKRSLRSTAYYPKDKLKWSRLYLLGCSLLQMFSITAGIRKESSWIRQSRAGGLEVL